MAERQLIKAECGCEIPAAKKYFNKEKFTCSKCGSINCAKHTFYYVDGNNISITKNAKPFCGKCSNYET